MGIAFTGAQFSHLKGSPMKTLILLAMATSTTVTFEDLDQLDAQISAFVGSKITSTAVDRRLRLAACDSGTEVSWLDSNSVAVRCASPAWRLRVPVTGGGPHAATARPLIKRGDSVEGRYEADDFDISITMIALEDGREGESIRVKNPDSGKPAVGIVTGAGTVIFSR
jgi:flagellar basal body P-ring formation protein FlgA